VAVSGEDSEPRSRGGLSARLAGFWLREEGLSLLLALLVIQLFLLPILGLSGRRWIADGVFSLLLVSGVAATARRRGMLLPAGVLVLLALAAGWSGAGPELRGAASLACLTLFALVVLARTLGPGPINRHRIEGAVAVYLLFGVAFGLGYQLVETLTPGSFSLPDTLAHARLAGAFQYFSLVTLTTVGFGDVTPVSSAARALATFEATLGQLYPAILIGWMVASLPGRRGGGQV